MTGMNVTGKNACPTMNVIAQTFLQEALLYQICRRRENILFPVE